MLHALQKKIMIALKLGQTQQSNTTVMNCLAKMDVPLRIFDLKMTHVLSGSFITLRY